MFGDHDWPLNASRGFVSISWASCFLYFSRSESGAVFVRVRREHTLNRYCVTVYGSILMLFSLFFRSDCPFRFTRDFTFSLLDGATFLAKLRSKIATSPKIGGKVCVHKQLSIDSWEISIKKFYRSTLQPGTQMCTYIFLRNSLHSSGRNCQSSHR